MYTVKESKGSTFKFQKTSYEVVLLKHNIKLKIQYLKNNKTSISEVLTAWFQVILKLRCIPSFGGQNGAVKTKGKNIYEILIYNNKRISIQP